MLESSMEFTWYSTWETGMGNMSLWLTKSPWFNIPFFFRVLKHPVKEFYQVRNAKTSDDRFLIYFCFSHN